MVVYSNLYLYTSRYLLLEKCHGNIAFVCFPSKCFKQVHNVLNIDFSLFVSMFFGFHLFFFFHIVNSNLGLAHLLVLVILLSS